MRRLGFLLFLVGFPLVASGNGVHYDSSEKGVTGGGRVDGDLQCVDDIEMTAACQLTSDAAPSQSVIRTAQDAYPLATVNTSGGDIVLLAGAGTTNVNVDDYTQCGSSNVTVTINGTAYVLTEAVSWTAATSNAATCASLCTAIDALTGVSCSACSTAKAPVVVDSGAYSVEVTRSAAACATVVLGTPGVIFTSMSRGASDAVIAPLADSSVGIFFRPGEVGFRVGSGRGFVATPSYLYSYKDLNMGISRVYSSAQRLQLGGTCANGSAGDICTGGSVFLDGTYMRTPRARGTTVAAPFACNSTYEGGLIYVNDTDDSGPGYFCGCISTPDDSTYAWVKLADHTTACF